MGCAGNRATVLVRSGVACLKEVQPQSGRALLSFKHAFRTSVLAAVQKLDLRG